MSVMSEGGGPTRRCRYIVRPVNEEGRHMTDPNLGNFLQEARQCAMEMLANASYIEGELPNVELPDNLRAMTAQLCTTLVGTKHDVISELAELDDADRLDSHGCRHCALTCSAALCAGCPTTSAHSMNS